MDGICISYPVKGQQVPDDDDGNLWCLWWVAKATYRLMCVPKSSLELSLPF
jgi:hypothetical protein